MIQRIGSHNSLTYLPPKRWWMRPFAWMARCQRVDYARQYYDYNVSVFDLRVWFDKHGNIQVRHGRMQYDISRDEIFSFLSFLNDTYSCSLRVILEEDWRAYHLPYSGMAEMYFRKFCSYIQNHYDHIKFFGGNRKCDWRVLYKFKSENDVCLDDKYSSTTSLFKSKKQWLAKIDDLWPWVYARLHNKENFANADENKCLFVDFVDIR